MFKYQCLSFALVSMLSALSQSMPNGSRFRYPLDQAPVLTGNYGEIRPNHFHAGIDFVTDPKLNLPIYAVEDGYISRIKISPYGYGKVIYITHPGGIVSVYAHQQRFCWKVNKYVTTKQTEQQKNDIELFPTAAELPVKKGELIGYTGNTGGSTGPHLHFELRDEKSEIPLNPLLIYSLADTVKPKVTHIAVYEYADTMANVAPKIFTAKSKLPKNDSIVVQQSMVSFAFAGSDKENSGTNPNNIYEAQLFFDSTLIYHHQLNYISFDNGRFVNAFSELRDGLKLQRCFAPQCYDIPIYKKLVNRGFVALHDTSWHRLQLSAYDERHNEMTVTKYIRYKPGAAQPAKPAYHACNQPFAYNNEQIKVTIPAGALYNASLLPASGTTVGSRYDYLQKPVSVALRIADLKPGLAGKYVLLVNGNATEAVLENGWLSASCKLLGAYSYAIDTVAPTIKPALSKKKLLNIAKAKSISFKISDGLSGIARYDVYINGAWQIAEYDAKSDQLSCYFTEQSPTGKIEVKVVVEDKAANRKELTVHTTRQ